MNIRPYTESDKTNMRRICIETANAADAATDRQRFLTLLYCDYYIEKEPQNCFVIANETDDAVGYVVCSENFGKYKKAFVPYLQSIKQIGIKEYIFAVGEVIAHSLLSKNYPAHLHIDILPEYQHKGGGTRLINALTEHLAAKGIHSLMLIVNSKNKNALKFYKKNGFRQYINLFGAIYMTIDF